MTAVYHTLDKSSWRAGPWQDEPDKIEWRDKATGYPCLIVRQAMGALCGYVGVPPGHGLHSVSDTGENGWETYGDFEVHGGITFTGVCQDGPIEASICHAPAAGEEDNVWWVGFDCAHFLDIIPISLTTFPMPGSGIYREVDYVRSEVESLARQLAAKKGE